MAENTNEGLKSIPKSPTEAKPLVAQETGPLTPERLERIYDLKQTDQLLKSVGSELPQEQSAN